MPQYATAQTTILSAFFPQTGQTSPRCSCLKGRQRELTFEAPHFLSPNSPYLSARNLYRRYMEYIGKPEQ